MIFPMFALDSFNPLRLGGLREGEHALDHGPELAFLEQRPQMTVFIGATTYEFGRVEGAANVEASKGRRATHAPPARATARGCAHKS